MSKTDSKIKQLEKYDVEASIEEISNEEESSMYKYNITALSNPKNVRLAIEGFANLEGSSEERNEVLKNDESNVPKILTLIYHELFPTFFLLSKNLNVSCPPHTISEVGKHVDTDDKIAPEIPETNKSEIKHEDNLNDSLDEKQVTEVTSSNMTQPVM